jgi:hypothetical protein
MTVRHTDKTMAVFEQFNVRRQYDEAQEKWWFSVVDILQILIQQPNFQLARNYWKVLKNRLGKEGSQVVTNCNRLKMRASDGKMRYTDVADVETLFRLIQSVPSPKAEPIKLWLAKVGAERIHEMADPAQAIDRARYHWQQMGRSEKWIQQRMMGQETRNKLTDYWKTHDIKAQMKVCYWQAVGQSVAIWRWASTNNNWPEQTNRWQRFSILSFGLGDEPGSGQRFKGSEGAPPSSRGIKWSSS